MDKQALAEIVRKAQKGDSHAKQELYVDSSKSVFFTALKILRNKEDAEDITQDVYITVFDKLPELKTPVAYYKWINQITTNKCMSFLRKKKPIPTDEEILDILELEESDLENPEKLLDDEATRRIIMEIIDALPDSQRICVIYRYFNQLSIDEIAVVTETNEHTVKSRLTLARNKIRAAILEKEEKDGIRLHVFIPIMPVLMKALDEFAMPDGVQARMWDNIQKSITVTAQASDSLGTEQTGKGDTLGRVDPKPGITKATSQPTINTGMTFAAKIIIGVVSAAVITAAVVSLPPLLSLEESNTPVSLQTSSPTNAPANNPTSAPPTDAPTSNTISVPTDTLEAITPEPETSFIPHGRYVNSAPNRALYEGNKYWFHVYDDGTFIQQGFEFEGAWYRSGTYTVSGDVVHFAAILESRHEDMANAVELSTAYADYWSEDSLLFNYTFRFDGTNLISVNYEHLDVLLGDVFVLDSIHIDTSTSGTSFDPPVSYEDSSAPSENNGQHEAAIPPGKYAHVADWYETTGLDAPYIEINDNGTFARWYFEFDFIQTHLGTFTVTGDIVSFTVLTYYDSDDSTERDFNDEQFKNFTYRFDGTNLVAVDRFGNIEQGDLLVRE